MDTVFDSIVWKCIDAYFNENPYSLVQHHLDSYNSFMTEGIFQIFKENNPIRFIERSEEEGDRNECRLYLAGKDGTRLHFGKPMIYTNTDAEYMYPNRARLRNMTYGTTIHYDVDVEYIYYEGGEKKVHTVRLEKIYLGRFPIMLHSNLCILQGMHPNGRYALGECRNDYGGYFIIDGKEKVIVPQETFANNMLYIRKNKEDNLYSYSAEIRSVSEDPSKPIRTTAIKIVAPSPSYTNNQIVVTVPNVRKPVPLFILMRALGIVSDKAIIETCLLDIRKNEQYIDLFIPSIHDAGYFFTQQNALEYIQSFTKRRTISGVHDILMNYFLPHIGDKNYLDKAYFVGYMVQRLLRVFTQEENPTDRDNFRFKRIELTGTLLYDLFREYFLLQKRNIQLKMDKEYYYHVGKYKSQFTSLVENNQFEFFKERIVEQGFRRAFKGNWGSETHTRRVGVVQDLNRLSWNTFLSQLRKLNLPLDASAKVVGPRLLHASQWGFIDPVDTPDGGNIGLHKHLALSTSITSGYSRVPLIQWIREKTKLRLILECTSAFLASLTKVFVNGKWIGGVEDPIEFVSTMRLLRRNGLFHRDTSISFDYEKNEIALYSDAGRLIRPLFFLEKGSKDLKISFQRPSIFDKCKSGAIVWREMIQGFYVKDASTEGPVQDVDKRYPNKEAEEIEKLLRENQGILEYVDTSEEEGMLIAQKLDDIPKNKYYTHLEWNSALLLGIMGNQIIYPENNPFPRNAFSCGQSKQAVSLYHSNYQMRMDKMGVVLQYGQVPLVKSRLLKYINKEEQPYGVNTVVAIMSYTGYNVEDAILINEGSIRRGLFHTTYYSMYETREESDKVNGSTQNAVFSDVMSRPNISRLKAGGDYSFLDKWGLVKEETLVNDKMALIGRVIFSSDTSSPGVVDSSVFPKKGQLGFVDKSFLTEGDEGFRIAKVRVREERMPAIGDKMASRSGQKGTIGLIIPEADMPYAEDGTRPDLIINPHAIPSRMTIGQLLETVVGKLGVSYGGFGNCTAFETKGPNTEIYGEALVNAGFHASGNQILYNGMTGEQLNSEIFMGPTYYMRLKHMVKDKINFRARGPNNQLTRQPVQGRANDGGLRIGEMERDGIMAHGASAFLNDSFMVRGDEYALAICNKTGAAAIYNPNLNLFFSPMVDGPVKFNQTTATNMTIENKSQFGRTFSIVRIPYALKVLMQELQVMNVQMRIITEDNVDQLLSMAFSENIRDLLGYDEVSSLADTITSYRGKMTGKVRESTQEDVFRRIKPDVPMKLDVPMNPESPEFTLGEPIVFGKEEQEYNPRTPEGYIALPREEDSIPYAPDSESLGNNELVSLGNNELVSLGNNELVSLGNNELVPLGNKRLMGNNEFVSLGNNELVSLGNNELVSLGNKRLMGNNEPMIFDPTTQMQPFAGLSTSVSGQPIIITGQPIFMTPPPSSFTETNIQSKYDSLSEDDKISLQKMIEEKRDPLLRENVIKIKEKDKSILDIPEEKDQEKEKEKDQDTKESKTKTITL